MPNPTLLPTAPSAIPSLQHHPFSEQSFTVPVQPAEGALDTLEPKALVVYSHLRWGFVYQRPQHLMARLAQRGWRVFFVEEPVHEEGRARLVCHSPAPGVTVVVPHTPVASPGFHDTQMSVLGPLLSAYFEASHACDGVSWFYTPMALPLLPAARPRAVVYDCMDELSAFKHAPEQLKVREEALMRHSDVVFTGGPSLFEARRGRHRRLMCLPSAVDAEHFALSRLRPHSILAQRARVLQGALPQPRLGYFGVIDERMDLGLVAHLARERPNWQIVMVGPVAKIPASSLPQAPNLHWLGMQDYELLPYLMAGWQVCLMPFAINESTRFISPTKTLEYMAGQKPVVSTPVKDVVALYGDHVSIADTPEGFVAACQALLDEAPAKRLARAQAMLQVVRTRSWNVATNVVDRWLQRVVRPLNPGLEEAYGSGAVATPAFTTRKPTVTDRTL